MPVLRLQGMDRSGADYSPTLLAAWVAAFDAAEAVFRALVRAPLAADVVAAAPLRAVTLVRLAAVVVRLAAVLVR